jgi:hypothetical protein
MGIHKYKNIKGGITMKRFIIGSMLTIIIAFSYASFNYHVSKATTSTKFTRSSAPFPQLKETENLNPIQINQTEESNGISLTLKKVRYGKDPYNKDLLEMYFTIESKNIKSKMKKITENNNSIKTHEQPLTTYQRPNLKINGKNENFWCAMDFKEITNDKYAGLLQLHIKNHQPKHFKATVDFFNIISQQGKWNFNFQI